MPTNYVEHEMGLDLPKLKSLIAGKATKLSHKHLVGDKKVLMPQTLLKKLMMHHVKGEGMTMKWSGAHIKRLLRDPEGEGFFGDLWGGLKKAVKFAKDVANDPITKAVASAVANSDIGKTALNVGEAALNDVDPELNVGTTVKNAIQKYANGKGVKGKGF